MGDCSSLTDLCCDIGCELAHIKADNQKSEAEASNWRLCWLKDLADEIHEENPSE